MCLTKNKVSINQMGTTPIIAQESIVSMEEMRHILYIRNIRFSWRGGQGRHNKVFII